MMRTIDANAPYCNPEVRHDFVILFDVRDGNPNGDPDAGNLPRVDPETMQGIVTDVCLKRKIRNYVDLCYGDQYDELDAHPNGYGIFVRDSSVWLNKKIEEAAKSIRAAKREEVSRLLCQRYYDIRMFGGVLSTGRTEKGTKGSRKRRSESPDTELDQSTQSEGVQKGDSVRGPVQLTFARSIDPITPLDFTITRVISTKQEDFGNPQIGRKPIVPYALYRAHGFFSPALAKATGVTRDDLRLLWEAMLHMFEHDRSAARGEMTLRGLYVFTHDSPLGNAHAHELFDLITVRRVKRRVNTPPRAFSDYSVQVDTPPQGVTLHTLCP